jgi:hypothetical protein
MTTTTSAGQPGSVAHHTSRLVAYRDDGLISQTLGRLARGVLPPLAPALVAAGITTVLLLVGADGPSSPALLAPAVVLLLAGPASAHPHDGRLDWLVPPLMRGIEYGYLAALGFAHSVSEPLIYVLIAVLAYHHYDTVYRTRQKLWPQEWVFRAGFGWDGRMVLVAVAAFAGVTLFAYAALAVYLGVLFGAESVYTWTRTGRGEGVVVNLEEEEEAS